MPTQRENEALRTRNTLREVRLWFEQQQPGSQLQSTQGDYDPSGHENADGTWTRYQSTNDDAGTLPCGP